MGRLFFHKIHLTDKFNGKLTFDIIQSVFRGMNNAMVYNSDQKTIYRDMDGDLHYTSSGAQQANERIARKRSRIID